MPKNTLRKIIVWLVLLTWSVQAWAAAVGIVYGLPHVHRSAGAAELAAPAARQAVDRGHSRRAAGDQAASRHRPQLQPAPYEESSGGPPDRSVSHDANAQNAPDALGPIGFRIDRSFGHRHDDSHAALADHRHGPDTAGVRYVADASDGSAEAGAALACRAAMSLLDALPVADLQWDTPAVPARFVAAPTQPLKTRNPPPLEHPPR